jgi:hypothetical protein
MFHEMSMSIRIWLLDIQAQTGMTTFMRNEYSTAQMIKKAVKRKSGNTKDIDKVINSTPSVKREKL